MSRLLLAIVAVAFAFPPRMVRKLDLLESALLDHRSPEYWRYA